MRAMTTWLAAGLICAAMPSLALADDAKPWEGGDAAAGKQVFVKCSLCHYAEAGKIKIGPPLWGVVGRPSASVAGYTYSPAMQAYHHVWTPENLFTYLGGPMTVVPGTKMAFAGLPNEADRKNVIAYLATLK